MIYFQRCEWLCHSFCAHKKWGRITKFLSLLFVCLFLVVSCSASEQTTMPPSGSMNTAGDGRITVGTTLKPLTLDPADAYAEKAKQLLMSAGFSKTNPAKVEIWYPSSSSIRSLTALVLKALAKKTMDGILQFELNTVESATAFKYIAKGVYPSFLLDWYPDFLDADNYIKPILDCQKGSADKGCENGGSQNQGSFYYSERMNQLIAQQRQERNLEARKKIFAEIQDLLAFDVPYIPLWQGKDYVFAQKGISGVQLDLSQNLMYKTIKK